MRELFLENSDSNTEKERDMKFVECLKKLASYSATLLKPQHMRPENMWEVSGLGTSGLVS